MRAAVDLSGDGAATRGVIAALFGRILGDFWASFDIDGCALYVAPRRRSSLARSSINKTNIPPVDGSFSANSLSYCILLLLMLL